MKINILNSQKKAPEETTNGTKSPQQQRTKANKQKRRQEPAGNNDATRKHRANTPTQPSRLHSTKSSEDIDPLLANPSAKELEALGLNTIERKGWFVIMKMKKLILK